jgi:hypothetical protein
MLLASYISDGFSKLNAAFMPRSGTPETFAGTMTAINSAKTCGYQ